ncbi:MAG: hypothetical protein K0S76_2599 [Herbinix sp.]|jgi:ketosteroid isomerase-like protein|nr:hypothetical protein [Herbinix sp.]
MRKKISLIIFSLLIFLVTVFSIFGKRIRDNYSPHVEVMPPIIYTFPDGTASMVALVNTCFSTNEEGITTAYIVEENSNSGEKAFYAKQIELTLGKSDGKYSDVRKASTLDALFIYHTDRKITDGERVVIDKISNNP